MRLARLPGIDRCIIGALAGESTALIKDLRATDRDSAHAAPRHTASGTRGTGQTA